MSLNLIQARILQPFIDETLLSLSKMADMNGRTDEGFIDDVEQFRFKGYAICAETTGAIDGVILMHHYVETAVAMGNSLRKVVLGDDNQFDEVNDEMADALAEWGNTVLGRATKNLSAYNLGIEFQPPSFIFDTDIMASLLTGVKDVISVPVHVDGVGRFYFNYLIRSCNADIADSLNKTIVASASADNQCVVVDQQSGRVVSKDQKILIVDDMKMVRKSMKQFLSKLGYENVVEAINGQDAIAKVASEQPDFMFLDIVMPEMNGNEALRQIRQNNEELPIVMLTSVADQNVIDECEMLGIDGYIIKPLTRDSGPEALGQFLNG